MTNNAPAQTIHGNNENLQITTSTGPMMNSAHWDVQYAKFLTFPHSPLSNSTTAITSSLLRPLLPGKKNRLKGTWVPSSSSNVSLDIFSNDHSFPDPVLTMSFNGRIYEEHFISKLNFTWPQLSCLSKYSIRGSRVMFVSYRDSKGQIQKFATRFSSSEECHGFKESLKCLKEGREVDCSIAMPSCVFFQGTNGENTLLWEPSMNHQHVPYSCSQQAGLSHVLEDTHVGLPQSFTALLANCCTDTDPGVPQAPTEFDLKCFLKAGSGANKSFIDMLEKMDNIIVGLGGGLAF